MTWCWRVGWSWELAAATAAVVEAVVDLGRMGLAGVLDCSEWEVFGVGVEAVVQIVWVEAATAPDVAREGWALG